MSRANRRNFLRGAGVAAAGSLAAPAVARAQTLRWRMVKIGRASCRERVLELV